MNAMRVLLTCVIVLLACSTLPAAEPAHNQLPQEHAYAQTLRKYLASLREEDFAVALKPFTAPAAAPDMDALCRYWVLSQHAPTIGGLASPASEFLLSAIEGDKHVMHPPADALSLAWLAGWDDAMNPYRGSAAVKRRAMAVAIVDLIMHDGLHERSPGKNWVQYGLLEGLREGRAAHSDCLGGTLIWLGYAYLKCGDVLPPDAREAYAAGLKKLVHRLNDWGPTALMTDMDLFASVSLTYISKALKDPEIDKITDAYIKKLYTTPRFFNPAGFWVDLQGFDASYNGISFYFANWAALASKRADVLDAVRRAYLLKSYLALPEPDGTLVGPTHFSPRTSNDSAHDQWGYDHRNTAGAMLSDDAAYLVNVPTDEKLKSAAETVAAMLTATAEKPSAKLVKWSESHWTGTLNFGFEEYPAGFYQRRRKLEQTRELLDPPFKRAAPFVKQFGDAFVIAKYADFGIVIHTGEVGIAEPDWPERAKWMPREKPFGFSGGSLSAFWTPAGGSILLGRRGGAQGEVYDKYEDWRLWPIHAVSGQTSSGRVFSSARILKPDVKSEVKESSASITAKGMIPKTYAGQGDALTGEIQYQRSFDFDAKGLRIRTSVRGDERDEIAEICETIPVYVASAAPADKIGPVEIQFRRGSEWTTAGVEYLENVDAVKVKRFDGAMTITFATPQRVKLSPRLWTDQYQSRATCRTILIDLRGNAHAPFKQASVEYVMSPAR